MANYNLIVSGSNSTICLPIDDLDISTKDVYDKLEESNQKSHNYSSFLSFHGKPIRSSDDIRLVNIFPSNEIVPPPPSVEISKSTTFHLQSVETSLVGGKGGFGQALRSIGRAIARKKETNFEECRDLEGRRIRDVEHKKRISEWETRKNELIEQQRLDEENLIEEEQNLINTKIEEEKKCLEKKESEFENAVLSGLMSNRKTSRKKKKGKKKKKKRKKKKNKKLNNKMEPVNYESLLSPVPPKRNEEEKEEIKIGSDTIKLSLPEEEEEDVKNHQNQEIKKKKKKKRTRKRKRKKKKKRKRVENEVEEKEDGQPPKKKRKL